MYINSYILVSSTVVCITIAIVYFIGFYRQRSFFTKTINSFTEGNIPAESKLSKIIIDTRRIVNASRNNTSKLSEKLEAVLISIMKIKKESMNITEASFQLANEIEQSATIANKLSVSASNLAELALQQSAVVDQSSAAIEQMSASVTNIAKVIVERKNANQILAKKSQESAICSARLANLAIILDIYEAELALS